MRLLPDSIETRRLHNPKQIQCMLYWIIVSALSHKLASGNLNGIKYIRAVSDYWAVIYYSVNTRSCNATSTCLRCTRNDCLLDVFCTNSQIYTYYVRFLLIVKPSNFQQFTTFPHILCTFTGRNSFECLENEIRSCLHVLGLRCIPFILDNYDILSVTVRRPLGSCL